MDRPPTVHQQRWLIARFAVPISFAVTQAAFSCYVSPETKYETADYSEPPAAEFLTDVPPRRPEAPPSCGPLPRWAPRAPLMSSR